MNNKRISFVSLGAGILLCGLSVRISKYEHTTLQNVNGSYSKLLINSEIYNRMNQKPRKNNWFKYYLEDREKVQKINQVKINGSGYEIILEGVEFPEQFTPIAYKSNSISLFEKIFTTI